VTTTFPPRRKRRVSDPTETINYTHRKPLSAGPDPSGATTGQNTSILCSWRRLPPDLSLRSLTLCALADVLDDYAEVCAKPAAIGYRAMGDNLAQPSFNPFIQMRFGPFIVQDDASADWPDIDGTLVDEASARLPPLRVPTDHHAASPRSRRASRIRAASCICTSASRASADTGMSSARASAVSLSQVGFRLPARCPTSRSGAFWPRTRGLRS
jgi:hypothetical protein